MAELSSRFVSKEGNVKGSSKGSFASLLSSCAGFLLPSASSHLHFVFMNRVKEEEEKRLRRMVEEWWRNIGGEGRERGVEDYEGSGV